MAYPSSDFERRKAFFHALSRVNTEASQYVYESLYKSAHSVRAQDIWLDDIPFCATESDADNFANNNPNILKKYVQVPLKEVIGSNGQAWYLEIDGKWIRPWIAPTDIPHPDTNAPSEGFRIKLYKEEQIISLSIQNGERSVNCLSYSLHCLTNRTKIDQMLLSSQAIRCYYILRYDRAK